jgi:FkbM family methyltransferase
MTETLLHNYLEGISLRLSPSHAIEQHILTYGSWESHLYGYFKFFIKPGFSCIDVGANSGIHTLTMAALAGDSGSVLAFEPSPEYISRLRDNIALNGNLAPRIECRQMGLSDAPGELKLFESGAMSGNAYLAESMDETLWNRFGAEVFTTCRVAVLDDEIGKRRVDLIKIDVEGMEAKVLAGALKTVAREKPILVYETLVGDFGKERVGKMNRLVVDQGYYRFFIHPQLQKLIPCYFPNLPEDVLAIHPDRLLSAAPIIHNCTRFVFNGPEIISLFGSSMFLTVIGLDSENYAIAWSQGEDDSPTMKIVQDQGDGILVFKQDWQGIRLQTFASVIFHHDGVLQETTQPVVQIVGPQGVLNSFGGVLGGILYRCHPQLDQY